MYPPQPPPPALQPQQLYPTPGVVIGFRVFAGFYAACCFIMVAYGAARVTGYDVRLGLVQEAESEPAKPEDWAVLAMFLALGVAMLGCAFLPARPSSWGVGLAAIILGLPCCVVPAVILLVFWCQTPARMYFATHGWKNLPPPAQPPPVPPGA